MSEEVKTASQQFADDYMLVVENDREGWDDITQEAHRVNYNMPQLSDSIKSQWETMVNDLIQKIVDEEGQSLKALLISQVMQGWGSSPFDIIAREVIARDKETLGIEA